MGSFRGYVSLAVLFAVLAAALAGCGSGSSGPIDDGRNGSGPYFHWSCNGDSQCLADRGEATGTVDEYPMDCTDDYDHAYIFWGVAAGISCNEEPDGVAGAPTPAVTLPTIKSYSTASFSQVVINGSDFPTNPDKIAVAFGSTLLEPAFVAATPDKLSVIINLFMQDTSQPFTVYVHGGKVTATSSFGFMNGLNTVAAAPSGALYAAGYSDTLRMSSDGITWNYLNAYKHVDAAYDYQVPTFTGIAASPTVTVLVGALGTILQSTDGVRFTKLSPSPTSEDLNGVIWSGTRFLAFGAGGTIITSTDGTHWTQVKSPTQEDILAAAWNGSEFVVCGGDALVMTSTLGYKGWVVRNASVAAPHNLFGIAWGSGTFVAIGTVTDGSQDYAMVTSPDGVTWTAVTSGVTQGLWGIASSGSEFVAAGSQGAVATSPDGMNWTLVAGVPAHDEDLRAVTYANGSFIAVGDGGTILESPDGVSWTHVSGY